MLGARLGHEEGYAVSGQGRFQRWSTVGAVAVRWQCDGEIPELFCMDRSGWRGLFGNLEEWLEMRSKYSEKLSRRYPVLA